jgi:hypothetical protein
MERRSIQGGGRNEEHMSIGDRAPLGQNKACDQYLQDDVARGLRASLVAVLATALNGSRANFDFLKGVFSLARSQAALYGIPWHDFVASLCDAPELGCLVRDLRDGVCLEYVTGLRAIPETKNSQPA